jgi:hypothetical protein
VELFERIEKMEHTDFIIVTNNDPVDANNFYLTDKKWAEDNPKEVKNARRLQKEGNLYFAYRVAAGTFACYSQMDAQELFIDGEGETAINHD